DWSSDVCSSDLSVSPRIRKHCPCPPNGLQGMFSVRSCALVFLTHPAASPSRVKTSDGLHGAWILIELSRIGEVPYPRSASCLAPARTSEAASSIVIPVHVSQRRRIQPPIESGCLSCNAEAAC